MYREEMLIILLLAVIAYLTWIGLELRHQRKSAGKAHYEFPQSNIMTVNEMRNSRGLLPSEPLTEEQNAEIEAKTDEFMSKFKNVEGTK